MLSRTSPTTTIDVPAWDTLTFQIFGGKRGYYVAGWGGHGSQPITSDFSRLYYLEEGEALVTTSRGPVHVVPGRPYLFPAGHTATYKCPSEMILLWVHFRLEAIPSMDVFTRYTPPATVEPRPGLAERFHSLVDRLPNHNPRDAVSRVALLAELVEPFLPEHWDELLPQPERVQRLLPALRTIQASVGDELDLKELAEDVHLHPTYFSNLFKDVFGIPPMRYLMELRIRRGKALLSGSDQPVAEVARECGFDDPFYFSRVFRRHTGASPRDFRRHGGVLGP